MYHLFCARHSFKHFICINSFNLSVTHEVSIGIIPILQMSNQSTEGLSNTTKVKLPASGWAKVQTWEIWF